MSRSKELEDTRKKLLLLQNGVHYQLIPSSSITSIKIPKPKNDRLPKHDWGYFGEYEYLGPGTPYTAKANEAIQPVNEIDAMAQRHDSQYQWSENNLNAPGAALTKSLFRGVVDYGAGAAMWVASFNPFNDLTFKDRVLGILAGEGLMIQGIVRVSPVGWTVGPMADLLFY